ncbi:MAG: hypothetical protein ATN35_03975 [Epulopiscium sp. Nele67-Bin004]|nr:MAG: hypothetical protein ATN35_03975 [Epulopiscium sp. Nele67-Bin004]
MNKKLLATLTIGVCFVSQMFVTNTLGLTGGVFTQVLIDQFDTNNDGQLDNEELSNLLANDLAMSMIAELDALSQQDQQALQDLIGEDELEELLTIEEDEEETHEETEDIKEETSDEELLEEMTEQQTLQPQPFVVTMDNPFADVVEGAWYYDSVMEMYERGIMNGITEDMFCPSQDTTRAMFMVMVQRDFGDVQALQSSGFSDLVAGAWYEQAINWAVEQYIYIHPEDNKEFRPSDSITREEMVYIIFNYAIYSGKDTSNLGDMSMFIDVDDVSPWAKTAMQWAVGANVMNGKNTNEGNKLEPQGTATRAEIATIMSRVSQLTQAH